jgi:hypothetical protein
MEGMVGSIEVKMWKHLFTMALTAMQHSENMKHYALFTALHLINETNFEFDIRSLSDIPREILDEFVEDSNS